MSKTDLIVLLWFRSLLAIPLVYLYIKFDWYEPMDSIEANIYRWEWFQDTSCDVKGVII